MTEKFKSLKSPGIGILLLIVSILILFLSFGMPVISKQHFSYGESIYGTGPSAFGYELGRKDDKNEKGKDIIVDVLDWRCITKPASAETGKPNKTYIHLLKWPNGIFELKDLKGKVNKAYLLADPKRNPLKFKQKKWKFQCCSA